MREFFSLDGAFSRYGGFLADIIFLSLMWIFFSIPIVTIGASTTAMFYVSTRRISNREGYITSDFWQAFKSNFKRSTLLWLIILVMFIILMINMLNIGVMGGMASFILPAQILILAELVFVTIYLFPVTARFEMGFKQTVKTCFFMANRHLLTTITCTILFVSLIFLIFLMPVVFFIAPGLYAALSSYMLMRVFRRYRPEMDKDPKLEIAEIEASKAEERRRAGISRESGNEESFTVWENGRIITKKRGTGGAIMAKYVCVVCGYVYDEAEENGVLFESLEDDWVCPICSVGKDQFEKEA